MTRPWYRSPVLWFALPGLVFLCVAWVDSMSNASSLDVATLSHSLSVDHENAHLGISWYAAPSVRTVGGNWSVKREPGGGRQEKRWFPLPSYYRNDLHRATSWHHLDIPHWFVILCYLGLWQLPWLWRYHRARRIQRTLAEVA
ncbi:hypothetical protein [Luteolibacter sp. Populi]|uniref:hypothetical protein n=1 Tax=Luteolibacter sp. Populi TaxID=3230487 RepID=UPI0034654A00